MRGILLIMAMLWLGQASAAGPDLLLLKSWQEDQDLTGWLVSEKLDGVRAYWDGRQLISRQGNAFSPPEWFIRDFPDFPLDGELWSGRGEFEKVSSIVSRFDAHEGWRAIGFHIFEVPDAPGGLLQRLQKLRRYLQEKPIGHLQIIPQEVVQDNADVRRRLAGIDAAGGEGLVVRRPDQPYTTGRSAHDLKVKSYQDAEARVIGYRSGKGKYSGMTGALRVETAEGVRFWLGSGLKNMARRAPPPPGSLVTYKYYGLTAGGVPRFASFLRVRRIGKGKDISAVP